MRKEILHERALNKFNRRDFRERKAKLLCYTSSIANQIGVRTALLIARKRVQYIELFAESFFEPLITALRVS